MRDPLAVASDRHRPHDLLWVDDPSALSTDGAWPAWATAPWLAVAPVVVRRAPMRPADHVPVGIRGATRSERCAAHVEGARVVRKLSPEQVARRASARTDLRDSPLACLRSLARLAPILDAFELPWGVTGSVGFTLASSIDVLRAYSDLDLLVRTSGRHDAQALRSLAETLQHAECRVDLQVETTRGAFALNEWMRTGGPVLLKTSEGPILCSDPWNDEAPIAA